MVNRPIQQFRHWLHGGKKAFTALPFAKAMNPCLCPKMHTILYTGLEFHHRFFESRETLDWTFVVFFSEGVHNAFCPRKCTRSRGKARG